MHVKVSDREVEILLMILRCGENAYGPAIREQLADRTGENLSYGALYSVLDRLAEKGLVETRMGEVTAERGGKRKRFYRINAAGHIALQHALHRQDRVRDGVPGLTTGVALA